MMSVTPRWRACLSVLLVATGAAADVSYVEEVVNAGVGAKHRGARRTVNEIHIQGQRQRVQTKIETSPELQRVLEKRGVPLESTTILRLDQGRLYDVYAAAGTFHAKPLPPPAPAVKPAPGATQGSAVPAGKPVAVPAPDREVRVRTKALPDTTRIVGILCRRVAAEMLVQHYKKGTKKVQRVNRYLYQAWMADAFPGYDEIMAFRHAQEARTSLTPLVRGGLEQLAESIDDAGRLEIELAALQGFPMQSELTVQTTVGSRPPQRLFKLSRRILQISHQPLPDSLFLPARELKPVP